MTEPAIETEARGANLTRLTSLRAFAALFVFGHHCFVKFDSSLGSRLFGLGFTGVAFFFVLSGFVLTWSIRRDLPPSTFYRRRFARIWPLHFVTGMAAGAIYTFTSVGAVVANVLLIQAWFPDRHIHYSLNAASWSLSAEFFFYALWPVVAVYAARAWGRFAAITVIVFLAGAVCSGLIRAYGSTNLITWIYSFPPVRLGEFLIGVAMATAMRQGRGRRVPIGAALLLLAVSWEVTRVFFPDVYPMPNYLLTPGYALLIWAAAGADILDRPGLLRHPVLEYAGKISFAFYLVHAPVVEGVANYFHHSAVLQVPVALVVATLFAMAGHHLLEVPANDYLRGKRTRETVGAVS